MSPLSSLPLSIGQLLGPGRAVDGCEVFGLFGAEVVFGVGTEGQWLCDAVLPPVIFRYSS